MDYDPISAHAVTSRVHCFYLHLTGQLFCTLLQKFVPSLNQMFFHIYFKICESAIIERNNVLALLNFYPYYWG